MKRITKTWKTSNIYLENPVNPVKLILLKILFDTNQRKYEIFLSTDEHGFSRIFFNRWNRSILKTSVSSVDQEQISLFLAVRWFVLKKKLIKTRLIFKIT